ncbi:MAG: hypothetical protein ABIA63_15250 [bacterium]
MSDNPAAISRNQVKKLADNGVIILAPESVFIGKEINPDNIEKGTVIGPAARIEGAETMIGAGTKIQGSVVINNSLIGRDCSLAAGEYADSVLLDGCSTVGWARIRGHSAWEEQSNCAHNVDTKTTVLGFKTTLGSLINYCNVLMLGGTSPGLEVGAEVGSGAINFNFLPFGATVGAMIKPSSVVGSIESPFLVCDGAPVRYIFVGGHSSIIAPVVIGLGSVIAAKSRINPGIYEEDKLMGGGNIEKPIMLDANKVKVLKDITPKYEILIRQMATTIAYREWFRMRIEWAKRNKLDEFQTALLDGFISKIDKYYEALEAYGDNIAKYLQSDKANSRPESLQKNLSVTEQWSMVLKPGIRKSMSYKNDSAKELGSLNLELDRITSQTSGNKQFYQILAKIGYESSQIKSAREYYAGIERSIVKQNKV